MSEEVSNETSSPTSDPILDSTSAEAKPAKKATADNVRPLIIHNKTQQIVARDNAELLRMINIFMQGQAFPKTLDTPAKAITAWQVAASLGLPPMVCIPNLAIINGSVSMWGQLPKGLADRTGQVEEFKIIKFDAAQKVICLENKNLGEEVWGAVTQMRRSKQSMNEFSFCEPDAKRAGLLNKAGPWKEYRQIMYMRRSSAHAIKFVFADALMGVPVAEYDFNEAPDLKDVTASGATDERTNDVASKIRAVAASGSQNESHEGGDGENE